MRIRNIEGTEGSGFHWVEWDGIYRKEEESQIGNFKWRTCISEVRKGWRKE